MAEAIPGNNYRGIEDLQEWQRRLQALLMVGKQVTAEAIPGIINGGEVKKNNYHNLSP